MAMRRRAIADSLSSVARRALPSLSSPIEALAANAERSDDSIIHLHRIRLPEWIPAHESGASSWSRTAASTSSMFWLKRLFASSAKPSERDSFIRPSQSKQSFSSEFSRNSRSRVADRPKGRRPSTPLSVLDQSRSARYRAAAAERISVSGEADSQNISRRWRPIKSGNNIPRKKKKKRPPPGPHLFDDLTAKTPSHSELPFQFRYSYTEIPKQAPIGFQERFSPFGPGRLDRHWDGQAAVPVSSNSDISRQDFDQEGNKKKCEWDSFNPPPRKKGIKPVAAPGPFLPGKGPKKKAKTREQILGEPLTKEEVTDLVEGCIKSNKQINLGRDGLTHNMLIDVHNHWKRERAVRIKCKGVSTVDMENVCFQIEDKTNGKIIYRAGGALYLFRGRNYNFKDRPNIPPMLWKPHAPIYPKLITETPGGLTVKEAREMRKRGRKIMPLCKLAKNGYYADLVQNVREAFEDDDLVRIDCRGLGRSDYKKIGAKLRDLVPCVLLSFQKEQILVWSGRSQKSSNSGSTAELEAQNIQTTHHVSDDDSSEDAAKLSANIDSSAAVDDLEEEAEVFELSSSDDVADFIVEESELSDFDSDDVSKEESA